MQMVAMLGVLRVNPESEEENETRKHSSPSSDTESDLIEIDTHSEESEIVNDPVSAT